MTNLFKNLKPEFFKGIIKTGIDYFYINLVDRLTAFFTFLLLARAFDSSLYGKIATVFAVSTIVMTVFDFGLPIYAQRESAKRAPLYDTLGEIFSVKIFSVLLYIVFLPLVAFVFYKDIPPAILAVIGAIILLQSISNLLAYLYFGKDDSRLVLKANVVSKIILLVIISVSYLYFRNIYIFLSGYIFSYLVLVVVYAKNLGKYEIDLRKISLSFDKLKLTLAIIIPIGVSSIFNLVYDKIDIVILSAYLDYNKVAQYSVAYTVYRVGLIVFTIILYPAFNQFSRLAEDYQESLKLLLKYSVTIVSLSTLIIVAFIFIVSGLIPVIFSEKYVEASAIVAPLSFATVLWALNALSGVYLNGLGKFKSVMAATLCGMVINIAVNIILIPRVGVIGAVYSTIITEAVILIIEGAFIFSYYLKNKLHYS